MFLDFTSYIIFLLMLFQMFNRLNHLRLCVGIKENRSFLDRIRSSYDTEGFKWKTKICDYLLGLRSDCSVSGTYTISYAYSEGTLLILFLHLHPLKDQPQGGNIFSHKCNTQIKVNDLFRI